MSAADKANVQGHLQSVFSSLHVGHPTTGHTCQPLYFVATEERCGA